MAGINHRTLEVVFGTWNGSARPFRTFWTLDRAVDDHSIVLAADPNEIQLIEKVACDQQAQPVIPETETEHSHAPSLIFEFDMTPPTFENFSSDPSVTGMPSTISRREETQALNQQTAPLKAPEAKPLTTENPERPLAWSNDRKKKLREFSEMAHTPEGLMHLEKQPAYLRRNVELSDFTPSSDSEVSRYTLTKDENDNVEVRPNNSFLHDNVD